MKIKAELAYQLKITLWGAKPPIWRRVLVTDNLTLNDLHYVIQDCMGWSESHLHQFFIENESFHLPEADIDGHVDPMFDERKALLRNLIDGEQMQFMYQYDFGDSWDHIVLVEKIEPLKPGEIYPKCIKGKRACPPEDCGGIPGYEELIEIMKNHKHEMFEEMAEWLDGPFDAEYFDLDLINSRLKQRENILTTIPIS